MAGSYNHVVNGWSLIENMGDAYGAVEQLMWLVERSIGRAQAKQLIKDEFYPMVRGERAIDPYYMFVRRVMAE